VTELFHKCGGYRRLDSYTIASIIQLATLAFCRRFLNRTNDPCGRQYDQMTQAARSGVKNLVEGSERMKASLSTAINLMDVGRASLCELRDDYNAWLMLRGQAPWPMDSEEAQRVYAVRLDKPDYGEDVNRGVCLHVLAQYRKFESGLSSEDAQVRANTLLILISRTLNMMDRYIKRVGEEFAEAGGFRERLTTVRSEARARRDGAAEEAPLCPDCGAPMRLRRTRNDNRAFWGCTQYPACHGVRDGGETHGTR